MRPRRRESDGRWTQRIADRLRRMLERFRWLVRDNWYRDLWLFVLTGLVLWAAVTTYNTAEDAKRFSKRTNASLCTFRNDLKRRIDGGEQFLKEHPEGIPGIPVPTIRQSLTGQRRTVKALRGLGCPPPKRPLRPLGPLTPRPGP